MRDIIWTIVLVWLVYKLIDVFKSPGTKKSFSRNGEQAANYQNTASSQTTSPRKDVKAAIQKHLNNDGDYVDFEEVK